MGTYLVLSLNPVLNEPRNGIIALFYAAQYCDVKILNLLVEYKAALDGTDSDGDTVVGKAIISGQKENAEYLLSVGALLGKTALVCAVMAENKDDEKNYTRKKMVLLVISRKALMNEPRNGITAVLYAAQYCGVGILTLLVQSNASLDGTDGNGDTAVGKAIISGKQENAEYLLSMGAPPGKTALADAECCKREDSSRCSLEESQGKRRK